MNEKYLKIKIGKKILNEPIGFGNSIIVDNKSSKKIQRHEMLRFTKPLSLAFEKMGTSGLHIIVKISNRAGKSPIFTIKYDKVLVDVPSDFFDKKTGLIAQRKLIETMVSKLPKEEIPVEMKSKSSFPPSGRKSKVMLFRNILNSPDKEECNWFSPGALYLASSLKNENIPFLISDSKISLKKGEFITNITKLENLLKRPEVNLIAITLCEDFFEKAKKLVEFIRERTRAFIAVGGPMPTLTPEHVFVHMPEVNLIIRGEGEEILPKIANILEGMNIESEICEKGKDQIMGLNGLIFSNKDLLISSKINEINMNRDYDKSFLDFSILERNDVANGLNIFTSRGCSNNCIFCTTMGKGKFIAKSFKNLKFMLEIYHERLKEIFGNREIPESAFKLSFNDDDFLGNPERATRFFNYILKTPFYIGFFQTGINSFFINRKGRLTDKLNHRLLESLSEDLFLPKGGKRPGETHIYIGTENFSDKELKRLGKGYCYDKVRMVVKELSKRKIVQMHHLILSNIQTSMDDIFRNLIRMAKLRLRYGKYFNILYPSVTNLVSLYPSMSYKIILDRNAASGLIKRNELKIEKFPEFDYPLIEKDRPLNKNVAVISEKFNQFQKRNGDYFKLIDNMLFFLLFRAENLSLRKDRESRSLAGELYRIIEKYHDYPKMILGSGNLAGSPLENSKSNMQAIITRRCQLRCRYCPVVKSGETMNRHTLFRGIEFLMGSWQKDLRLDFTGGEPMLSIQNVKDAVRFARNLAKKMGKTISFYMVTNLIGLNQDIAKFLERENFRLELSIDGDEHTHNLNKIPVKNGLNPYKIFTKKIKLLNRTNNLAVVVATPQTVDKLYDNFRHILDLGFRKIEINYALGLYWDKKSVRKLFEQLGLVMKNFHKEIRDGEIMLGNLSKRTEPAILNSEIMLDTDGSIHLLPEWIFHSEPRDKRQFTAGDVNADFKNIFTSRFHSYYIIYKAHTSRSRKLKKIVINNILLGIKTGKFFRSFNEYGK